MAVVITVAQQKGGAGKTTLVANLAAALAATRSVALLDIDPQHSLSRWHAIRTARSPAVPPLPAITFSDVAGWRLAVELERLRKFHDVLLVDSPPQIDTDARRAIRGADLVVIPIQPSPPDLWAAEGTLKLAAEEKRPTCLVLNRVPSTGKLRDSIAADLKARGLIVLPAVIGNRPPTPRHSPTASASPNPHHAAKPPPNSALCWKPCSRSSPDRQHPATLWDAPKLVLHRHCHASRPNPNLQ